MFSEKKELNSKKEVLRTNAEKLSQILTDLKDKSSRVAYSIGRKEAHRIIDSQDNDTSFYKSLTFKTNNDGQLLIEYKMPSQNEFIEEKQLPSANTVYRNDNHNLTKSSKKSSYSLEIPLQDDAFTIKKTDTETTVIIPRNNHFIVFSFEKDR